MLIQKLTVLFHAITQKITFLFFIYYVFLKTIICRAECSYIKKSLNIKAITCRAATRLQIYINGIIAGLLLA